MVVDITDFVIAMPERTKQITHEKEIIACDGKNIYGVLYSPESVKTTMDGGVKVVPSKGSSPARVSGGPYPVDYSSAVGLIWLAFFGGHYVDKSETQIPFPNLLVPDARQDPMAWACDMNYKLAQNNSDSLISSAQFLLNGGRLSNYTIDYPEMDEPGDNAALQHFFDSLHEYKSIGKESLARSIYYLDESTNLNGLLIPTKFRCTLAPMPNNLYIKGNFFYAVVTNIVIEQSSSPLLPDLKGSVWVEDRRLRIKNSDYWRKDVYYSLGSDGWITDTNDARIQAALWKYRMIPRFSKYSKGEPPDTAYKHRTVVLIFFLLTCGLIAFFLKRNHWRPRFKY